MKNKELNELLRAFYQISGMEISLMDMNFHSMSTYRCQPSRFCSLIHASSHCLELCRESDKEHLYTAKATALPEQYVCPFGIREIILPVKRNEAVEGYLFCSLGVDSATDTDELAAKARDICPSLSRRELLHALSQMKSVDEATTEPYMLLLGAIGEYIESHDLLPRQTPSIGELVKNYVKNNLASKITLTDIAWSLHCSTVTITQRFRSEFGISVMEYVNKKRMSLARRLLTDNDSPLHEIAAACGFPDVEYFSRCFKRHSGMSPGAWRKKMREESDGSE